MLKKKVKTWSSGGILTLRYGLAALGGVSSLLMGTEEEAWGGEDDIEERLDTRACEAEEGVFPELTGLSLTCAPFPDGEAFSSRAGPAAGPADVDDDDVEACSRAALRFSFPLSTLFFATVVWSLHARSN